MSTGRYQAKQTLCYITNGINESEIRKPQVVFHSGDYSVEWTDMEFLFHNISSLKEVLKVIQMKWQHRQKNGHVAKTRQAIFDIAGTTAEIKKLSIH